jgi:ABC-type enterochelin transport system permease subunit
VDRFGPIIFCGLAVWFLHEFKEGVEHEDLVYEGVLQGVVFIFSGQLIEFLLQLFGLFLGEQARTTRVEMEPS